MRSKKAELTRSNMAWRSSTAKRWIANTIASANKLNEDTNKKERLEKALCKCCFYLSSGIGGAAMTSRDCAVCDKEMHFGSTNTDAMHIECAKKHELCSHCGADINLRETRKSYSWELVE